MSQAIGISFGPQFVTVTKAQDDGLIDHVKHATSPAYQELFQHVLQQRVQSDLESRPSEEIPNTNLVVPKSQGDYVERLLREELEAVVQSLPVDAKVVPAIMIPYHWTETLQRAMFKAAEGAKMPMAGIHMLVKLPRALERAYQLDSRLPEDDYFFIVVDYNTSYLHLLICETAKDGGYGIVAGQVQLPHLGEKSASAKSGYREEILEAVRRFLSLTTVDDGDASKDGRPPRTGIKAVIVSGDASSKGMQVLRDLLKHFFEDSLLLSSHPPLLAGALGAARTAKQQVADPKSTNDFISMPHGDIPEEPKPS
ncbi:MAG: hypothetical protein Q9209_003070 [Squamulea sp. 1 TL-2023]